MSETSSDFHSAQLCIGSEASLTEEQQSLRNGLFNIKNKVSYLKKNAQLQRSPLSVSIHEMMQYINTNIKGDHLASGFLSKKDNPFEDKKCEIL